MYRTSNGNTFTGKAELSKPFVVFTGDGDYVKAKNLDWKFMQKVQGNSRVYFSKYLGQLKIFKKPLSDEYFEIICSEMNCHEPKELHPALKYGFENELIRLFPEADESVLSQFQMFVNFLVDHFSLSNQFNESKTSYFDDIGPYLVVDLGLKKSVIPELPMLYLAPKSWREFTWAINNNFIGPYPKNDNNVNYTWGDYDVKSLIKTEEDEGLVLFLIAKFIIIQEAWMQRKSCDSLVYYIDLIMNHDLRPTNI